MKKIKVSICCITYNQVDYIADALDSFINQDTSFDYEILVNDDASTDGTLEVLTNYEARYPDLIKVVSHKENQFSKGITDPVERFLLPISKGKYIALCEGDDYWIDAKKIQKQFDIMEGDPTISLCTHAHRALNASTSKPIRDYHPFDHALTVDYADMLRKIQTFATASFFVRKDTYCQYADSPIRPLKAHGDHKLSLYCGAVGKVYYIDEVMSIYRVMAKGSINRSIATSNHRSTIEKNLLDSRTELLEAIDEMTKREWSIAISEGIDTCKYKYAIATANRKELLLNWKNRFSQEGSLTRVIVFIKNLCPEVFIPLFARINRLRWRI